MGRVLETLIEPASQEGDPESALPPIYRGNEGMPESFAALKATAPVEMIPGILHERSKLIIGAPAKAGKTFLSLGLAHALSSGLEWLGIPLVPRKVMIADLELHEHELNARLWHISAEGGKPCLSDNLHRLPLRIHPENRKQAILFKTLERHCEAIGGVDLIILDCLYRFLDGLDENAASDMSALGAWLDRLVTATSSAVCVVHHFGKGSPGQRDQLDRFRGSSTLAGEFDALVTLVPHEEADHYIMETTCRSFVRPGPLVLRFDFPHFRVTECEPIPKKPGKPQKVSDDRILEAVPFGRENAMGARDLAATLGMSRYRMKERLDAMNGVESDTSGVGTVYWR